MPLSERASLRGYLQRHGDLTGRTLAGFARSLPWGDILRHSYLSGAAQELAGRSVLLRTEDQLASAAALIELDGLARRIVLCPPGLPPEHLPHVIQTAEVDCCVLDAADRAALEASLCALPRSRVSLSEPALRRPAAESPVRTEWVLLTSGTTGTPKLVLHSLESLTGAITTSPLPASRPVWSTFYDIRRYGGLQIFLRAVLTGATLVLSDVREATGDFLARAASHGITHLSGTPSHWRRALMSPAARAISPRYVRLSGEIADAAILHQLNLTYPQARVAHAFASTEAGVAFEVEDGLPGIPADVLGRGGPVELKIEDDSLRIRSRRVAERYLGENAKPLKSADGFVDTGDMIELRGNRYHFSGRRDGVINVGGAKVHPEEVEAVLNRHPGVRMSMVRARKSPITGAVIVADVVLRDAAPPPGNTAGNLQSDLLLFCRDALASHKVPAAIKIVASLPVSQTGKLVRHDA